MNKKACWKVGAVASGVGFVLTVFAPGCAASIVAREKPMLACAQGEDVIPIAHYQGAFKWQCGRVPVKCALGQKVKFFIGDNKRSGVDDIRWECLEEAQQQRPAGLSLTLEAHCEGTKIAASLSRAMECRKAWQDTAEHLPQVVHEAEDWKPCEPKSVANQEIALRVGDSTLRATTSTQGKATFDLSEVKPNEVLVSTPKADLMVSGNIAHMAVASVDLSRCEVFPVWQQKLKLAADAKRLEIDSQRREHAIRCLEIAENAIASIANGKTWTRERMDSYVEAVERLEVVQRSLYELSPLDVARTQRVRDKLDSLLPSLKKQVAANQARVAQQVIPTGRQIVLSMLRAPSTARFADDGILLQCPSGMFVTRHVVDAQNGFGATVRNEMCATFNMTARVKLCWNSMESASGINCSTSCGDHVPFGRLPTCDYLERERLVWRPY